MYGHIVPSVPVHHTRYTRVMRAKELIAELAEKVLADPEKVWGETGHARGDRLRE